LDDQYRIPDGIISRSLAIASALTATETEEKQ